MKNKMKVDDVAKTKKRVNQKSRLVSATEPNHLKALKPIPKEANEDPVKWASSHLENQIPQAAKELEWALKFGDDKTRREIALEILSFKGIAKKSDSNQQVVPAIQLIMSSPAPWSQVTINTKDPNQLVEGTVVKENER